MKKLFLLLIGLTCFLFASSAAMAIGFGVYGDFSRGVDHYGGDFGGDFDDTYDYKGASGGLILDSAAAKNDLLNYRLRFGAGKTTYQKNLITNISLVQTFGFSSRSMNGKNLRFWFGPRIGLHYLTGKISSSSDSSSLLMFALLSSSYSYPYPYSSSSYMLLPMLMMGSSTKESLECFKLDIGLVFAGFNMNFGDNVTFSIELGFDYAFMVGKIGSNQTTSGNAYGESLEGFGVVSFMYRINDTYAPNAPKE